MERSDLCGFKSDVWLEYARTAEHGCELMIRFSEPLPTGHGAFWLPISTANGALAGWMRFAYVTTVRTETIFAGAEWRPATEPAPAEQDILLPLPGRLSSDPSGR